jgi:hypothetical protein
LRRTRTDFRTREISFHQLNKKTGHRIRYRKVDAETGQEVESSDIIKGYEVAKGEYIELDPEEFEAIALESKRTIEIEEFVPKSQIDELYIRDPYYIAPDGEVGQQAFAVIREAIRKEGMVAIGKVVFTSREHIIALEGRDKGMMGITLRYPYEVRKQSGYFEDIKDEKVPKDMLDLAPRRCTDEFGRKDRATRAIGAASWKPMTSSLRWRHCARGIRGWRLARRWLEECMRQSVEMWWKQQSSTPKRHHDFSTLARNTFDECSVDFLGELLADERLLDYSFVAHVSEHVHKFDMRVAPPILA